LPANKHSSASNNIDGAYKSTGLKTIELKPLSYSRESLMLTLVEGGEAHSTNQGVSVEDEG
jgi:hypothetical protein